MGETQRARGHGLQSLTADAASLACLDLDEVAVVSLGDLARDYQPSRYPEALADGTPMDHYTERRSRRAVAGAAEVVERVAARWIELLEAQAEGDDEA